METFFLNVSEVHITDKNKSINTILGSCVSVIFFVPRLKLSAICHARLPEGEPTPTKKNGFCFVDSSMIYMLNTLKRKGAIESEMIIKAFGGSQLTVSSNNRNSAKLSVGEQNVNMVKKILAKYNLQLSSYDFGGTSGRKLIYHTHKNEVLIKLLTEEPCTENHINTLLKNFIFNR